MAAPAPPLLLDTQLLLWLAVDPERLPEALREELADRRRAVLFSVASLWEVAINTSLDRLLVAQACCEGLTLLSADRVLGAYGPEVRWIGAPPVTPPP